jgi:hypothetical protein
MKIQYERLQLINGGRFDFWTTNVKFISQFIEKNRIKAIEKDNLIKDDPVPISPIRIENIAIELKYLKPKPFPGGMRVPHLHFKDDIYLLNHEQWKDFSAMAVKNFQEKLAKVETVSFDKLMELSDAIETFG